MTDRGLIAARQRVMETPRWRLVKMFRAQYAYIRALQRIEKDFARQTAALDDEEP